MMSPRRHWLPLLSALALLLSPFALAPRGTQAANVTYSVDTLSDASGSTTGCVDGVPDGDCSLRQALTLAGAAPAADVKTISFDQITSGESGIAEPWEIVVDSPDGRLPEIKSNTILDADVVLTPRIIVNGNGQDVVFNITGSNSQIVGLSIIGATSSGGAFRGTGVYISGSNNSVSRSYIGIRPNGVADANFTGIRIEGANNTIGVTGGPTVANYISGNTQNGVIISNASNNVLVNNIVGLYPNSFAPFSLAARPNAQYGVQVISTGAGIAQNNRLGGTSAALANIIGGNGQAGIQLSGTGTTTNTIQVNYIGIDRDTDTDLGNSGDGVRIEDGARGNILGVPESPLVISGNTGYGVLIRPNGVNPPNNNRITGQVYIGTNRAGTNAIANDLGGVRIDGGNAGASNNSIQGSGNSMRIAGNGGVGIQIIGSTARNNRVEGAIIGLTPTAVAPGSVLRPNARGGIQLTNARGTAIVGNTISGNTGFGLRVSGTDTVTVTGNFVGLSLDRKAPQGNAGPGIQLWNARNTLVGGAGASNVIAGNAGAAVVISGTNSISVALRTNLIGLVQEPAATSTSYLARGANGGEGVLVTSGARSVVLDGNTVAGSADTVDPDFAGISVVGDSSVGTRGGLSSTNVATVTITANRIGWVPTAAGSSSALPFPNGDGVAVSGRVQGVNILTNTIRLNQGVGVRLTDVLTTTVGGNIAINRNRAGGIFVAGASANLTIRNNQISDSGKDNGGAVLNSGADAIFLDGPIRGAQVISNTIRANTGRGIALQGNVDRATLRYNQVAQNGSGIRLVGSTRYSGTGADTDTLATPNHGIDAPIVDLNFASPLSLRVNQAGFVEGYVYTSTQTVKDERNILPASACISCTIQIFRPDRTVPTDTQGWELVRTIAETGGTTPRDTIGVAANGRFSARIQDTLPSRLLLIATDGYGNSSEYATLPLTASLALEPISPLARDASPGETVTYTLRLRNTGTLGYSNLRLATLGTLARWAVTTTPITTADFGLAAGASRLITVTLRLPTGSDPNVVAGKQDRTTVRITGGPPAVTATAELVTTVLPRPVITVTPRQSVGSGRPEFAVPHAFTITNNGNVTVTLDLASRTVDPANSPGVWLTSVSTTTLTLPPGRDGRVGVSVTVPRGALQNTTATTFLTATVRAGTNPAFPSQTVLFSATTRADLNPNADFYPDLESQGAAGGLVPFTHTVENKSNGTAKFCLDYFTTGQSTVRFESATNQFVIDAQGCFTLYAAADVNPSQGRFSLAQIRAVVTVDRRLTTDDIETVTIFLRKGSTTGESISDATVEDRIRVNAGFLLPRLWLPLIHR